MKHLRIWLLLLLAILIPVRGAMSAAMLCLPQDPSQSNNVMIEQHGAATGSGLHDHAQHDHHAGGTSSEQEDDAPVSVANDCNLCASFCSLTTVASAPLELLHPHAHASLNPAPTAPVPSFVSDGEERPPRTI